MIDYRFKVTRQPSENPLFCYSSSWKIWS